ncbi:hypothetical protein F2Q69_00060426 [Brassica cretica]|uniref:AAA+ ATPase domain-containing protein n=1 Tax=Brassica cretica TaxID=69181 RepID=A0A8S9RHG2_BRACR|nr:hypothetical protein F2Q69_00060426 [Brassica cretica]
MKPKNHFKSLSCFLFGPPGTGKTMIAKAIANEAGASFINVSMSTITSKWFGEDEKNVRALFTLAAKVSATIIFVDEVDSMLGQRTRVGEHEAMTTNRPFDLNEAIIRRSERRIMVGLPPVENREKILRTLLSKEQTGNFYSCADDGWFGYSGSDLKNFCTTAAYRPVRELIKHRVLERPEGAGMNEMKQWNKLYGEGGSRKKEQLSYSL